MRLFIMASPAWGSLEVDAYLKQTSEKTACHWALFFIRNDPVLFLPHVIIFHLNPQRARE